jgi:hypothetical protein
MLYFAFKRELDWNTYVNTLLIILIFVFIKCDNWFENNMVKLIVNFLPYCLSFCARMIKLYFNFIYSSLFFLKTLFFIPFIPLFLQCLFTLSILFNYIWDCYLLFTIYSLIFVCIPKYLFQFFSKKQPTNFFFVYQIKIGILIFISMTYPFQISLNTIFTLLAIEIFKLRNLCL